jgi:hypothetical protein
MRGRRRGSYLGRVPLQQVIDRKHDPFGSFFGIDDPLDRNQVAPPMRRREPVPDRFGLVALPKRPSQILRDRDLFVVRLSAH